jgi:hypothetical protein
MGVTPDRQSGPSIEEELQLTDEGVNPSVVGAIVHKAGDLLARDSTGIFNLRSGTGLSAATHQALRQLIHFIDNGPANGFASGAYRENTGTVFPTAIIWYDDNTKVKKLVEKLITYTGSFATTIQWKMYDTDGSTVLATVTDVITLSGSFEASRTRTIV